MVISSHLKTWLSCILALATCHLQNMTCEQSTKEDKQKKICWDLWPAVFAGRQIKSEIGEKEYNESSDGSHIPLEYEQNPPTSCDVECLLWIKTEENGEMGNASHKCLYFLSTFATLSLPHFLPFLLYFSGGWKIVPVRAKYILISFVQLPSLGVSSVGVTSLWSYEANTWCMYATK